jgi:type IV secretory pathway VirB2 component (pilin)
MSNWKKYVTIENAMMGGLLLLYGGAAMAQGMPWEEPICMVARSLSGPMATAVAIIAIVISGLLMAFGELGGIFKTMLGLLIGICMAIMGAKWIGAIKSGATACGIA